MSVPVAIVVLGPEVGLSVVHKRDIVEDGLIVLGVEVLNGWQLRWEVEVAGEGLGVKMRWLVVIVRVDIGLKAEDLRLGAVL